MLFELKKMWKKITIGVILLILVGGASFFVGGVIGFGKGYSYSIASRSAIEGMGKVSILRAVREGRTAVALESLEGSLDTDIVEQSTLEEGNCFLFNMFCMNTDDYDRTFMSRIVKYRKEYPIQATDPEVKKRIEQTLKKYETTDGGN
ncbi:MAG: hypothetical protein HZB81_04635 [Deltaproteobacteria bacterium]|nr:hypothetical protein [Deltaproteobacteria bacterium]